MLFLLKTNGCKYTSNKQNVDAETIKIIENKFDEFIAELLKNIYDNEFIKNNDTLEIEINKSKLKLMEIMKLYTGANASQHWTS